MTTIAVTETHIWFDRAITFTTVDFSAARNISIHYNDFDKGVRVPENTVWRFDKERTIKFFAVAGSVAAADRFVSVLNTGAAIKDIFNENTLYLVGNSSGANSAFAMVLSDGKSVILDFNQNAVNYSWPKKDHDIYLGSGSDVIYSLHDLYQRNIETALLAMQVAAVFDPATSFDVCSYDIANDKIEIYRSDAKSEEQARVNVGKLIGKWTVEKLGDSFIDNIIDGARPKPQVQSKSKKKEKELLAPVPPVPIKF